MGEIPSLPFPHPCTPEIGNGLEQIRPQMIWDRPGIWNNGNDEKSHPAGGASLGARGNSRIFPQPSSPSGILPLPEIPGSSRCFSLEFRAEPRRRRRRRNSRGIPGEFQDLELTALLCFQARRWPIPPTSSLWNGSGAHSMISTFPWPCSTPCSALAWPAIPGGIQWEFGMRGLIMGWARWEVGKGREGIFTFGK